MAVIKWPANSAVPRELVRQLPAEISQRKMRLLGVGLCRRIWDLLPEDTGRRAVEAAERYADGLATDQEFEVAGKQALGVSQRNRKLVEDGERYRYLGAGLGLWLTNKKLTGWHILDSSYSYMPIWDDAAEAVVHAGGNWHDELGAFCDLTRCVFGNPYTSVEVEPHWRSDDVMALARSFYESRDADILPVLADALMEAGCTSEEMIHHCRAKGPHVRGCWVVDKLLGKE